MFDIDDVDEAKRMLPIYKRAVDLLETVSGKKTEQAEQEPVIECDCETTISPDGSRMTKCGSNQMRCAAQEGHAFCKHPAQQATVSGGLCGGCAKKAADGWALYCVECWEKAEQPVSQEYQDHLVNQSFDWAAMAAKHQFMEGYRIGLAEMREKCAKVCEEVGQDKNYHGIVAAIRAIKFEGDTGFRPVSEMVAEHKQDPKKAAAIEKAKMRKAEQEPLAWQFFEDGKWWIGSEYNHHRQLTEEAGYPIRELYAAPVRTKDLTVLELDAIIEKHYDDEMDLKAMILDGIAAYKEKNNANNNS